MNTPTKHADVRSLAIAQHKRREAIRNLMPRVDIHGYNGYSMNDVAKLKDIIKLVKQEPDKKLQFEYFNAVMKKVDYFMQCFGNNPKKKSSTEFAEVLKLLRMLKQLHFDIDYKPGCMLHINAYVRSVGGTVKTKEEMREEKAARMQTAVEKLQAGDMPRKKKKAMLKLFGRGNEM